MYMYGDIVVGVWCLLLLFKHMLSVIVMHIYALNDGCVVSYVVYVMCLVISGCTYQIVVSLVLVILYD